MCQPYFIILLPNCLDLTHSPNITLHMSDSNSSNILSDSSLTDILKHTQVCQNHNQTLRSTTTANAKPPPPHTPDTIEELYWGQKLVKSPRVRGNALIQHA